jgi:hypothetical protein
VESTSDILGCSVVLSGHLVFLAWRQELDIHCIKLVWCNSCAIHLVNFNNWTSFFFFLKKMDFIFLQQLKFEQLRRFAYHTNSLCLCATYRPLNEGNSTWSSKRNQNHRNICIVLYFDIDAISSETVWLVTRYSARMIPPFVDSEPIYLSSDWRFGSVQVYTIWCLQIFYEKTVEDILEWLKMLVEMFTCVMYAISFCPAHVYRSFIWYKTPPSRVILKCLIFTEIKRISGE